MGLLGPISLSAAGAVAPQQGAKPQTPPGLTVAVAATTKAVPEVRRDVFVFAPSATSAAAFGSFDDASNANDREAEAARASAQSDAAEATSLFPPPRRDKSDPVARFIPEPKPLVGPAPARIPLIGFETATNPTLEQAAKAAQAEQAYRGQQDLADEATSETAPLSQTGTTASEMSATRPLA
jgi:hypothetical protein